MAEKQHHALVMSPCVAPEVRVSPDSNAPSRIRNEQQLVADHLRMPPSDQVRRQLGDRSYAVRLHNAWLHHG